MDESPAEPSFEAKNASDFYKRFNNRLLPHIQLALDEIQPPRNMHPQEAVASVLHVLVKYALHLSILLEIPSAEFTAGMRTLADDIDLNFGDKAKVSADLGEGESPR